MQLPPSATPIILAMATTHDWRGSSSLNALPDLTPRRTLDTVTTIGPTTTSPSLSGLIEKHEVVNPFPTNLSQQRSSRWLEPWEAARLSASHRKTVARPQHRRPGRSPSDGSSTSRDGSRLLCVHAQRRTASHSIQEQTTTSPTTLVLSPQPSAGQLCPFNANDPAGQWSYSQTIAFDFCLDQAFSALNLTPEETTNRRPPAQFLEAQLVHDDLLFQLATLLAATSAGDYGYRVANRPLLTWLRYNVLGALKAALAADKRSTESLIGVIALLTGWERAYGDAGACGMHLQALRKVVKQSERPLYEVSIPRAVTDTPPPTHASHLPMGFAMLYAQRLLPDELMSSCAIIASANMEDFGIYDRLRRTSLIMTGLGPNSDAAAEAFAGGHITAQVAKHVRLASLMCITLLMVAGQQEMFHHPLMDGVEPTLADAAHLPSDLLIGTVYDDVLLWSLCVFYMAAGRLPLRQLLAFRDLMDRLGIPVRTQSWLQLRDLMRRFVYHSGFDGRLQWVMGLEEAAHPNQSANR